MCKPKSGGGDSFQAFSGSSSLSRSECYLLHWTDSAGNRFIRCDPVYFGFNLKRLECILCRNRPFSRIDFERRAAVESIQRDSVGIIRDVCLECCKDDLKRRKRDQIEPSVLQSTKKDLNHTVRELDFNLRYYSSEKFTAPLISRWQKTFSRPLNSFVSRFLEEFMINPSGRCI